MSQNSSKQIASCASILYLGTATSAWNDCRGLFVAYRKNAWDPLPKLPFCFVQGPKHAPVIEDRYVLLIGAQRRLSARRGAEPPGYLAKQGRFDIGNPNEVVQYYGDDVIFYDAVERVYGSAGKSEPL